MPETAKTEKPMANAAANTTTTADTVTAAKTEAKVQPEALSVGIAIKTPDGEPRQPELVKEGQLVRVLVADRMIDSITKEAYTSDSWKEAVPSVWLDGQLKAEKIAVK